MAIARPATGPLFAQPQPTSDPQIFRVRHPSDGDAYHALDALNKQYHAVPLRFPPPRMAKGSAEPVLTLKDVFGGSKDAIDRITAWGQIVFHSTGDCGSTRGTKTQNEVTDKMVADFDEPDQKDTPQFNFLLGDVVYSFGESQFYYDQFYEPYRDYPAPILAVAGNHDGMISPLAHVTSLDAFLRNFCAERFEVTPDAGGLNRTAQIQPGVFFTFEAPFVRILALYSNTLEDPGVIADSTIGKSQLDFLKAALLRVKKEKFKGALLLAHHHPAYVAGARHGWSVEMQSQIDAVCEETGVWPHADLAGHAHNYQRFTRFRSDGTHIPYIVCGNGGHNVQKLHPVVLPVQPPVDANGSDTPTGTVRQRAPGIIQAKDTQHDQIQLENYDDTDYGYLRLLVTPSQLRIEYHPASDGPHSKTPDDSVTIDLATRKITHFTGPADNMTTWAAAATRRRVTQAREPKAKRKRV